MLWLTQMMGYNEYIPLLIRQMNDAEEKLYPTITPAKRNALIKISQITPIVTDQVFLCFKMS